MDDKDKVRVLARIIEKQTGAVNVNITTFEETQNGIDVSYSCLNTVTPCTIFVSWWAIMFM